MNKIRPCEHTLTNEHLDIISVEMQNKFFQEHWDLVFGVAKMYETDPTEENQEMLNDILSSALNDIITDGIIAATEIVGTPLANVDKDGYIDEHDYTQGPREAEILQFPMKDEEGNGK